MPIRPSAVDTADSALRRELYFLNLYRLLEAALLTLLVFGPGRSPVGGLVGSVVGEPLHPRLAVAVAVGYLMVSLALFVLGRRGNLRSQALLGAICDIAFGITALHALPAAGTGIGLMMLFNIAAAALLLPLRLGLGVAVLASLAIVGEYMISMADDGYVARAVAEPVLFIIGIVAISTLTNLIGRQMRASHQLAERRGLEAANLAEVNELIIRRLRTGVLLVDGHDQVRLANEAAMVLLGDDFDRHGGGPRNLAVATPELARRLASWRATGKHDESPVQLAPDVSEVVPRFTRLLAGSDQALVFLDDTSLVSRRAESITLATLGRFSASLAHEIRNPLAAISYAVQLLEESHDLPTADRRLLEIVHQQCIRMNGIVENVLALARREPAQPEHVELVGFAHAFAKEYSANHPLEHDTVRANSARAPVPAVFDPRQLHQVLTVLVHNALIYGRLPGEAARVTIYVDNDTGTPVVDVLDRGPGIPESVAEQLFRPFYTTSSHGTGLGLYIARELCRANQASLDYVPLPAGGSCFRIRLPTPHAMLGVRPET